MDEIRVTNLRSLLSRRHERLAELRERHSRARSSGKRRSIEAKMRRLENELGRLTKLVAPPLFTREGQRTAQ